ncbi:branched-chain amino acid transporter permease [Lachnospiraceae bacterium LCP25S3_G4]
MPVDVGTSLLIILAVALTTFGTRVVPFLIFPQGKEIPKLIQYLGKVLTPAVIGMLVVYCLKSTVVIRYPFGMPEFIAVLTVVGLHIWKRNNLLSIGVGTVLYMVLVQFVFV